MNGFSAPTTFIIAQQKAYRSKLFLQSSKQILNTPTFIFKIILSSFLNNIIIET